MSRARGIDRTAVLLLGLVLLAGGAAVAAWGAGLLDGVRGVPAELSTSGLGTVTDQQWWPWALGALGVVLALLALWWLLSHLPRGGVDRLLVTGSGARGRLTMDASSPVDVAADVLAETPGIRSARGRMVGQGSHLVADLRAVVEPTADLAEVTAAADDVAGQLATVLGRDDVRSRVRLVVARRGRSTVRVR